MHADIFQILTNRQLCDIQSGLFLVVEKIITTVNNDKTYDYQPAILT